MKSDIQRFVTCFFACLCFTVPIIVGEDTEFMLLTTGTSPYGIKQYSLTDGSVETSIHTGEYVPVSLAYDSQTDYIYWTTTSSKVIFRTHRLTNMSTRGIYHTGDYNTPGRIGIDQYENFLFFTDIRLGNIVRMSISAESIPSKVDRHVIVKFIHSVNNLQVDVVDKKIYWFDPGMGAIERSDYDGLNREQVQTVDITSSIGTAFYLDIYGDMYWSEPSTGSIHRIEGHTNYKEVVYNATRNINFLDIQVLNGVVYFTDLNDNSIFKLTWADQQATPSLFVNTSSAFNAIIVYSSKQKVIIPESGCLANSCSHTCIPLMFRKNRCACSEINRRFNHTSCEPRISFQEPELIVSSFDDYDMSVLTGIHGDPSEYIRVGKLYTWRLNRKQWHWAAMDIDYENSRLLLADKMDNLLTILPLTPSHALNIAKHGISSSVKGLAYDWMSRNLYWTDNLMNTIQMMPLASPGSNNAQEQVKTVISAQFSDNIHGIAVHPGLGKLFWSEQGGNSAIFVSDLIGRDMGIQIHKDIVNPRGIAIDYKLDILYWADGDYIKSVDLVTKERKQFGSMGMNFVDLTLFQEYVIGLQDIDNSTSGQVMFFERTNSSSPPRHFKIDLRSHGIRMFAAERQPTDRGDVCVKNICDQMCVAEIDDNGALKPKCVCGDTYDSDNDGLKCNVRRVESRDLIAYSLDDRLCTVPFDISMTMILKPSQSFTLKRYCFFNDSKSMINFQKVAVDIRQGMMFYASSDSQFYSNIRVTLLRGQSDRNLLDVSRVTSMAVDWLSFNIYYTSSTQIFACRYDGSYIKALVTGRQSIRDMELDLAYNRILWTESDGTGSRIMSSNLDGSNVQVFHEIHLDSNTIASSPSLCIDFRYSKIHFVHPNGKMVMSIDLMNGANLVEMKFKKQYRSIRSIDVIQDFFLLLADDTLRGSSVHVVEMISGTEAAPNSIKHLSNLGSDLTAYHIENQPDFNEKRTTTCRNNNGGCDQLCMQFNDTYLSCQCVNQMKLDKDGKSCIPQYDVLSDHFFLVTDDYGNAIYQMDSKLKNISSLPLLSARSQPGAVAFDARTSPTPATPISATDPTPSPALFYYDIRTKTLRSMNLAGTNSKRVLSRRLEIQGMAFDASSGLLYATTKKPSSIVCIQTRRSSNSKTLVNYERIRNPRAIALHPTQGHMYAASIASQPAAIYRFTMDGTNREEFVKNTLHVVGLSVDIDNDLLYWCDGRFKSISRISLQGLHRRTIFQEQGKAYPYSVVSMGSHVYWTDWLKPVLMRSSSDIVYDSSQSPNITYIGRNIFSALNDIIYVNKTQLLAQTSCSVNNGNCSHLCTPAPESGRNCLCPDLSSGIAVLPIDTFNCPGVETCPLLVGQHSAVNSDLCSRRAGVVCDVLCHSGYRLPSSSAASTVTCQPDSLTWTTAAICELIPVEKDTTTTTTTTTPTTPTTTTGILSTKESVVKPGTTSQKSTVPSSAIQITPGPRCHPLPLSKFIISTCEPNLQEIGTKCQQKCSDSKYTPISGSSEQECRADRSWSGEMLVCKSLFCPTLYPLNPQTTVSCSGFNVNGRGVSNNGTICVYACTYSDQMNVHTSKVTCHEGEWIGETINCGEIAEKECDKLEIPENSDVFPEDCKFEEMHVGNKCTFSCKDGYKSISGKDTYLRVCGLNEKWTNDQITCKRFKNGKFVEDGNMMSMKQSSNSNRNIALGVVFGVIGLCLVVCLVGFLYWRQRRNSDQFAYQNSIDSPNASLPSPGTSPMYSVEQDAVELEFSNPSFDQLANRASAGEKSSGAGVPRDVVPQYLDMSHDVVDETC